MKSMEVMVDASIFNSRVPILVKLHSSTVKNKIWCSTIRNELYTRKGIHPILLIDGCWLAYSDRFLGSSALSTLVRR